MHDAAGRMTQTPVSSNPYGITLYPALSPTGAQVNLQTPEEADWYEDKRDRYQHDNHFPNISDLMDLDRLLTLEVMVYRWTTWLTQGYDYIYAIVDAHQLKNNIKDYSTEIRLLKLSLGIDKATRDKTKGESLSDYTAELLERAKEFGYHRNAQYELAVTKFYELRTMVLTYDRCDKEERAQLDLSLETIVEWIRTKVVKDWDRMSDEFRKEQAIWIRKL